MDDLQDSNESATSRGNPFLLLLALVAGLAMVSLLLLLNTKDLAVGSLVVLAGVGGIIGASLSPLLDQRSERVPDSRMSRILTQLFAHVAGGFGLAAATFVITSALLLEEPGKSGSELGTAAFGGVVGFFVGRAINRMRLGQMIPGPKSSPAVVAAFGELEDQLFSRPLVNYDGSIIVRWHASTTSSRAIGRLEMYMVARNTPTLSGAQPGESAPPTAAYAPMDMDIHMPTTASRTARVLVQGGKDASLVPFAFSVISGAFDVQPQRLVLAVPSEGSSETLEFTLLEPDEPELEQSIEGDDVAEVYRGMMMGGPVPDPVPHVNPRTTAVLIDVSQGGKTVQMLDMEIPFIGQDYYQDKLR